MNVLSSLKSARDIPLSTTEALLFASGWRGENKEKLLKCTSEIDKAPTAKDLVEVLLNHDIGQFFVRELCADYVIYGPEHMEFSLALPIVYGPWSPGISVFFGSSSHPLISTPTHIQSTCEFGTLRPEDAESILTPYEYGATVDYAHYMGGPRQSHQECPDEFDELIMRGEIDDDRIREISHALVDFDLNYTDEVLKYSLATSDVFENPSFRRTLHNIIKTGRIVKNRNPKRGLST